MQQGEEYKRVVGGNAGRSNATGPADECIEPF